MSEFKLLAAAATGQFDRAVRELQRPIDQATVLAMRDTTALVKQRWRAEVTATLGTRFGNAVRSENFKDTPMHPAGFLWIRSTYAGIFETGGTIKPTESPYLFIPIKENLPANKKWTPELYEQLVGPLDFVSRPGKAPLLVGLVSVNKRSGAIRNLPGKKFLSDNTRRTKFFSRGGAEKMPLFIGVSSVHLRARFNQKAIAKTAMENDFPKFFAQRLAEVS